MKSKTETITKTEEQTIYECEFCGKTDNHEFRIATCEKRHRCEQEGHPLVDYDLEDGVNGSCQCNTRFEHYEIPEKLISKIFVMAKSMCEEKELEERERECEKKWVDHVITDSNNRLSTDNFRICSCGTKIYFSLTPMEGCTHLHHCFCGIGHRFVYSQKGN